MARKKTFHGKVRWFDSLKGEGIIRRDDSVCFFVHYSAIVSKAKWRTLTRGNSVSFTLYEDSHFVQVDKVKEIL